MAAGSTYTPIATYTVSSPQANYTFSSLPSTYTDLVMVIGNATNSTDAYTFTFGVNGDTGTNYSGTILYGTGSSASSYRYSNNSTTQTYIAGFSAGLSNTNPSTILVNFQNYSNTSTYKTVLARASSPSKSVETSVWLWRNTNAISSITIYGQGATNLGTGTTLTIYGIAAA